MFAQIERGLTVEFRAKPKEGGADDAEQKALKEIDQRARVIQFPRITLEPLLLKGEEVVPDDNEVTVRHSKKTQKTTTTTSKKAAPLDAEPKA